MPNPFNRRRIAASRRNRFDRQYAEFVGTLEAGTYPIDEFAPMFLEYFGRTVSYENTEGIRGELERRGLVNGIIIE